MRLGLGFTSTRESPTASRCHMARVSSRASLSVPPAAPAATAPARPPDDDVEVVVAVDGRCLCR